MAGGAGIYDRDLCVSIFQNIQHTGQKKSCIQCPGFSRFQINLYLPFFLCHSNASLQSLNIISWSCNMMTTAKIDPFHFGNQITELFLYGSKGCLQIIRVLLTEGMVMNPIQKFHQLRILHNCFIPLYSCCTHAASRCTRVINLMSLLGRAFRIDPESHAFSCLFRHSSKAKKLGRRIKYNMIGILKKFLEFIRPVTCTEYMNFFSRHFLCP